MSGTLHPLRAAIELSRRPGVGAAKFKALVDQYGSPLAALEHASFQSVPVRAKPKKIWTDEELDQWLALPASVGYTCYGAADYPWSLRNLTEPPPYLFHTGSLWPLPPIAVAIVGPRDCSQEGAHIAKTLAAQLAALGVLVVSGGARGIDTAAHQGALEGHGFSVLLMGTGIDRVYPPENQALFQRISERGCLLTELLPGTPPRHGFFPTRNRILVGLSDAVILIEGTCKSGTQSTAQHALRQHKPLFVWAESPCPVLRELPNQLLEQGAIPLNSLDPKIIMEVISPTPKGGGL